MKTYQEFITEQSQENIYEAIDPSVLLVLGPAALAASVAGIEISSMAVDAIKKRIEANKGWWKKLSVKQQLEYLRQHPESELQLATT